MLAIHRLSPIVESLTKGDVQVIACDLPKELVRRMNEYNFWLDDGFKKTLDHADVGHQRDTLIRVRQAVTKLIDAKHRCVWLYTHKDDFAVLCTFT
jgi:translation initiation factor 2-alpha kinase 4